MKINYPSDPFWITRGPSGGPRTTGWWPHRCTHACSEAGFSSQNGDRAWGVDTLPKSSVLLCIICWQKDSMQRIFKEKCSLFRVGSVCHVKQFTTGWKMFRWWLRGWKGGAETTFKRLPCCGFRRAGKVMGQMYQSLWRIYREIKMFSRF
jgi:hypothetical protein